MYVYMFGIWCMYVVSGIMGVSEGCMYVCVCCLECMWVESGQGISGVVYEMCVAYLSCRYVLIYGV